MAHKGITAADRAVLEKIVAEAEEAGMHVLPLNPWGCITIVPQAQGGRRAGLVAVPNVCIPTQQDVRAGTRGTRTNPIGSGADI